MGFIHARAPANKAISGTKASILACLVKITANPVEE
jgi:hypothetical protein